MFYSPAIVCIKCKDGSTIFIRGAKNLKRNRSPFLNKCIFQSFQMLLGELIGMFSTLIFVVFVLTDIKNVYLLLKMF